ncbi:MAG: AI-2E family transporter [Pirellulales bacterium]
MARSDATVILGRAFLLFCGVIVVAALYFARDVLLPLALAILLSFLLSPVVARLEKWRLGRIPSVVIVVVVAFGIVATLTYVLLLQAYEVANQLPEYKDNIVAKVESFRGGESGIVRKVSDAIDDVRRKVLRKTPPGRVDEAQAPVSNATPAERLAGDPAKSESSTEEAARPVPVEIIDEFSAQQIAQNMLGPVISPLAIAGLVVVFTVFMLIERENLRNRVIHLIGSRQLNVTTQALDDAAHRVSRYLLMQLIVNSAYGLVIAVGLFSIGLPNAFLWGMLTAVMRFVPYVGPWIAATLPIALSLAVFEGWTQPILVLALFIVNELISNNVIEPWLYGSSTGISTMGILVSAVFWTWLWGPVGLIMATPLTVCLTVIGRYVPQLAFLNTLLSDEEVLPPEARFYQRLLALDPEEAADVAEEYLQENSLESLYDRVLLPALSLAEEDRHHGDLDEEKQRFILTTMRELVDELGAKAKLVADAAQEVGDSSPPAASVSPESSVLCLPARDEADEIAGAMLAQLLEAKGVHVLLLSAQSLSGEMVSQVSEQEAAVVCVSALPPLAATHARYLCKRLRPKFPTLKIVVGLWQTGGSTKKAQARLVEIGIDQFATTLAEATQHLVQIVGSQRLLNGADASIAETTA